MLGLLLRAKCPCPLRSSAIPVASLPATKQLADFPSWQAREKQYPFEWTTQPTLNSTVLSSPRCLSLSVRVVFLFYISLLLFCSMAASVIPSTNCSCHSFLHLHLELCSHEGRNEPKQDYRRQGILTSKRKAVRRWFSWSLLQGPVRYCCHVPCRRERLLLECGFARGRLAFSNLPPSPFPSASSIEFLF